MSVLCCTKALTKEFIFHGTLTSAKERSSSAFWSNQHKNIFTHKCTANAGHFPLAYVYNNILHLQKHSIQHSQKPGICLCCHSQKQATKWIGISACLLLSYDGCSFVSALFSPTNLHLSWLAFVSARLSHSQTSIIVHPSDWNIPGLLDQTCYMYLSFHNILRKYYLNSCSFFKDNVPLHKAFVFTQINEKQHKPNCITV